MQKINTSTIKKLIKEQKITEYYYTVGTIGDDMPVSGIYHKNDWDHGYDGHAGFCGTRREFYKDFYEIIDFIKDFINETKCSKCIIAPFKRYKQFKNFDKENDIFIELHNILKENKIRINSQAGLEISLEKDFLILEAFIEGAFRGISLNCIYFEDINVLLTPTHHFEMPFWTYDEKYFSIIKRISDKYENLCFYQN